MEHPAPDPCTSRPLPPAVALGTVAICLLFGGNAVAMKLAYEGFGPLTSAGLRFALAALAIGAWAAATGRRLRLRPGQGRLVAVLVPLFTAQMALMYLGVHATLASRAAVIANVQPLLVLLLAHFLLPGERLTWRRGAGAAAGIAGVTILLLDRAAVESDLQSGDLLCLTSVVIWSANTIYIKRIIDDFEPFQLAFYPMLAQAPLLLAAGAVWDPAMLGPVSATAIGALVYQGLVTAGFGFVVWMTLTQRYGAVALNSHVFVVPLAAVALSGIVLGEPVVAPRMLAALGLVVVGILAVNVRGASLRRGAVRS